MEIVTSWVVEKGRQEGTTRILLLLLARLCGPLPSEVSARVSALPIDALDRLSDELLDFASLADLERWLVNERYRQVIELDGAMEDGLRIGFGKGYRQGLREGQEEGSTRTLVRLLTRRFGRVPRDVRQRIGAMAVRERDRLTDELFRLSTLEGLECMVFSSYLSAA